MVYSELPEYDWVIASTSYKDDFYGPLYTLVKKTMIVVLVSLVVLIIVTIQVSDMIIKPIKKLEETVLEGVNGNLNVRVKLEGKNEIAQLAKHFNNFMESLERNNYELMQEIEMRKQISMELEDLNNNLEEVIEIRTLALEEAQREIIEVEKFESINKLIKSIAHNMNTPLGVCITSASYIDNEVKLLEVSYTNKTITKKDMEEFFENSKESYALLVSELGKSAELVNMFKLLTNDQDIFGKKQFNVKKSVESAINKIELKGNKIELMCDEDLELNSYFSVFDLIINNLVKNAVIHAFSPTVKGVIEIKIKKFGDNILLSVKDNGKGISGTDMPHIFEPFYKDESRIANIGLGLSIIQNSLTHILNGTIEVYSEVGVGTEFELEIPID